jgi:hypothetical protein
MADDSLQIPVEQIFARIKALCESRQYTAALPLIEVFEQYRGEKQLKYPSTGVLTSYKGLCVARGKKQRVQGMNLCRLAADMDFYQPECFLNLGRVCLDMGRRSEAHDAFKRGLSLDAKHPAIHRELARMGRRKAPPISFLPRKHFLNRLLGKFLRKPVPPPAAPPGKK